MLNFAADVQRRLFILMSLVVNTKGMKKFLFLLSLISTSLCLYAQTDSLYVIDSKDRLISNEHMLAIQQMNYHTISMSRIIHNQSLESLDYEFSQLLNNLTVEHIIDLPEIKVFREKMMWSVQSLQVTAEERRILQRLQDYRQSNFLWRSVSMALNPTMIITNSGSHYQLAFYALLTAARGTMEYKSQSKQLGVEEIQALWELRKTDMGTIKELRTDAFSSIYDLYRRFKLEESLRLVEQDAELYANILNEDNAEKRLRRLLDNYDRFSHLLDYEYYLGMAYLDAEGYDMAAPHFDRYLASYAKTPIFRNDEKSAFVYLAQLAYGHMPPVIVDDLINEIVRIIPNNGPALMQCVLKYIEVGMNAKAFDLIRKGLDNPYISNRSSLIMMAVSLSSQIKKYPKLWEAIQASVLQSEDVALDAYVAFLACCQASVISDELNDVFQIDAALRKKWILFGKKCLKDNYEISINRKYLADLSTVAAYYEETGSDRKDILQSKLSPGKGIYTHKKLISKVPEFKDEPMLLYNFFTPMGAADSYIVKPGLDAKKEISQYNGAEALESKWLEKTLKKDLRDRFYSVICKGGKKCSDAYDVNSIYAVEKNCIRIVLDGQIKSIITFIYDSRSGKVVPFSLMSDGINHYLMDTSEMELLKATDKTPPEKEKPRKDNFFKRLLNRIF